MLKTYPKFYPGQTKEIEDSLNDKEKKILEDFLKYCRITAGEKKVNDYKAELLKIRHIIGEPYDKWNKKDKNGNPILIQGYLALLNHSHLEKYTRNTIKTFLKKFLKWKFKDLSLIEDIKSEAAFNDKRINENTLVTPEEIEKLMRTADSLKWKAIISLMVESAARPQEVRMLKWKDIRFTNDGADITLFSDKTRKARTIPLRDCVVHLKRWKEEYSFPERRQEDYVFPNPHKREEPLSNNVLPQTFRRLCKKAGIRHFHPYLLRHSKLTSLYTKMPEQIVKKYAGHSKSSSMPSIYSHISSKDLKDIILKEFYPTEEITEEERNNYEKRIAELEKSVSAFVEFMKYQQLKGKKTSEDLEDFGVIVQKGFQKIKNEK